MLKQGYRQGYAKCKVIFRGKLKLRSVYLVFFFFIIFFFFFFFFFFLSFQTFLGQHASWGYFPWKVKTAIGIPCFFFLLLLLLLLLLSFQTFLGQHASWGTDLLLYKMTISEKCNNSTVIEHSQGRVSAARIPERRNNPVGIWCQNDVVSTLMRRQHDVVSTLMRRHHIASTLIRRHFGTKCPLGRDRSLFKCQGRGGGGSHMNFHAASRVSLLTLTSW